MSRLSYEDRSDIEDLLVAYAHTIDSGDLAGFAELFRHGMWLGREGYDEVLTWLRDNVILYDGDTWTQHLVSNIRLDLGSNPDQVSALSCIAVVQQPPGEALRAVRVNTYQDTFVRAEGSWRFETRTVVRRMMGDDSGHLR
jgi:3-phenylpropionate/cinnamic acid dioxygenase small subunit